MYSFTQGLKILELDMLSDTVYVYSSPIRGLEHVLLEWPKIRNRNPKAVLKVFYGFR
jgi:hypothetical protein